MIDGGMIGATTAVRDGERGREVEVVALAHHLRDQEGAERRDVGHRRAGDAAEEHAVEDVDVGEPAAEAADEHGGEVDDDARHAAARGDVAGEDEERRRQEQVGIRQEPDEARRDDDRVERRDRTWRRRARRRPSAMLIGMPRMMKTMKTIRRVSAISSSAATTMLRSIGRMIRADADRDRGEDVAERKLRARRWSAAGRSAPARSSAGSGRRRGRCRRRWSSTSMMARGCAGRSRLTK